MHVQIQSREPVRFFRIAHARTEGGGGREGKGLAKLARFLKSLGMFRGISQL